ncbi:polyketide cyclase [Paenibacillus albiflavus]|uniref:Polyketide cyclase n=1 Tax=Paenibacillus albiflavus TaxID=2545760 RepID=A0A4R4EEN0_9BACL|nr:SRPBCC family protein [Paenibacillus albiflavus]TCZ78209.1 polyketide cyclase [Paenibacillus albiflavus]
MTIGENEIISSREIDVPRELVFRAWTTPNLLAQWWGPNGFTSTFHECDVKPGGEWLFTMHGPNGVDYPNHNVFAQIVPIERVVIDHLSSHEFRVTGTFEDLGGRTKITFRQLFKTAEDFEQAKPICVEANEQVLDRLSKVLAEMVS